MSWLDSLKTWIGGKRDKAAQSLTADPAGTYRASTYNRQSLANLIVHDLPPFTLATARIMLESDPLVRFALNVRNAAMSAADVEVKAANPRVKKWVEDQWKTLWNKHRGALTAVHRWGFAAIQPLWKECKDGTYDIADVKEFAPEDVRPLAHKGRPVGVRVRRPDVRLLSPRSCWITFDAEAGAFYGNGCLRRMYQPWYYKWMQGGQQKLLQQRMLKDAYIGDIFWYPADLMVKLPDGTQIPWKDITREIAECRVSGSALNLPMLKDREGNKLVEYTPPQDIGGSSQIFDWGDKLNEDILLGADVAIEVVKASETGSGFSGRSIPLMVTIAACDQELVDIVKAVEIQILRPAAWLIFGGDPEFELIPKPLMESFAKDAGGSPMGGSAIGGQAGQGGQPPQVIPQRAQPAEQFDENTIDSVRWNGLEIAIEFRAGEKRKPHHTPLSNDYGHFVGYRGKDGDSIDAFIGNDLESEIVFVVDQRRESGRFDEHKVMVGFTNLAAAQSAYFANYPPGWKIGGITPMTAGQFVAWLEDGNANKAIAGQVSQFDEQRPPQTAPQIVAKSRIEEIRQRAQQLAKRIRDPQYLFDSIVAELRQMLPLLGADLSAAMYGAHLGGYAGVIGEASALSGVAPPITPPPPADLVGLLFPEGPPPGVRLPALADAIDTIRKSPLAAGADFRQTAELVRQGAFAVTGDLTEQAVDDLRQTLARTLEKGGTVDDFTAEVRNRFEDGGPLSKSHLETIFRTQTAAAQSNGQDAAIKQPMVADAFPYRAYYATTDARVRETHIALEKGGLDGTNIYRADDPTWKKFRPPWEFNCRCAWSPVSVEQAARRGVTEARDWWNRAQAMAKELDGDAYEMLPRTVPFQVAHVPQPPFAPPAEFERR